MFQVGKAKITKLIAELINLLLESVLRNRDVMRAITMFFLEKLQAPKSTA